MKTDLEPRIGKVSGQKRIRTISRILLFCIFGLVLSNIHMSAGAYIIQDELTNAGGLIKLDLDWHSGIYVDFHTGSLFANEDYSISNDYIDCRDIAEIVCNQPYRSDSGVVFYDRECKLISGVGYDPACGKYKHITVPKNAVFMIVSCCKDYTPEYYVTAKRQEKVPLYGQKLTFPFSERGLIRYNTGVLEPHETIRASDYIDCSAFERIAVHQYYRGISGIAFYDNNKVYLTGYGNSRGVSGNTMTCAFVEYDVPEAAKFFRVSSTNNTEFPYGDTEVYVMTYRDTGNVGAILDLYKNRRYDILHTLKAPADVRTWIVYGDSIFASGYQQITTAPFEQPPRGCNADGFPRELYQKLNEGRDITWRNAGHSDWRYSGTSNLDNLSVDPVLWGKQRSLSDGATASITITGAKMAVFLFVGDRTEKASVSIQVAKDGGPLLNPSSILKGEITKKGTPEFPVYETAAATSDLGFTVSSDKSWNRYSCFKKIIYNGLEEGCSYTFRFTAVGSAKLWGCGYTTADMIDLVYVNSRSGMSWNELYACRESDIYVPEADYVILEAPLWHDHTESEAKNGARKLISDYLSHHVEVILCSCPPGGIVVTGSAAATLGDEFSASYYAGQNIVKDVRQHHVIPFGTALADTSSYPVRGEEYCCTIEGQTYKVRFWADSANYNTTKAYVDVPDDFPENIPSGTVFSRLSSLSASSLASFTGTSCYRYSVPVETHRDLMASVANEFNIPFIDLLAAFEDIAHSVGEEIDSDPWDMASGHPFYAICETRFGNPSFPTLKKPYQMNYMSNFFKMEDGHHLEHPAHDVIWTLLEYKLFKD